MAQRDWIITISLAIGIPLFAYILTTIDLAATFRVLKYAQFNALWAYLAISIAQLIGYTATWHILLTPLNITIPPLTLFNYRMTDFALSYVTPGPRLGGELTRSRVAAQHADTPTILVSCVMEKICIFITGFAFDIIAVLTAIAVFPVPAIIRYTLYVLLAITALLFYLYHHTVIHDKSITATFIWFVEHFNIADVKHYEEQLNNFEEQLKQYFTHHTDELTKATILSFLSKASIVVQVYLLLVMFNLPGTLLHAYFLATALDIAYAVPGYMGIGVLEVGQLSVFKILQLPANIGVLIALITRVRDLLFSGYGLLMVWLYGKET